MKRLVNSLWKTSLGTELKNREKMTIYQHISGEIDCYINCVQNSPLAGVILLLTVGAIFLYITHLFLPSPGYRTLTFASGQFLIITAVWLSFTTMVCNSMFSINIYIFYTVFTLGIMFIIRRVFDRFLARKLKASPLKELVGWGQDFVDKLVNDAKVFYYDSAIPQAFACRRSIFLSIGLLELLSDEELKAVLAHESWHIIHNSKTHWLKQLSIMTFLPIARSDIEVMADRFAANIAGQEALHSARNKIFPGFNRD